jgi:hypothetical protein
MNVENKKVTKMVICPLVLADKKMRARKTEKRSSLNNVTTSLLTLKKTY